MLKSNDLHAKSPQCEYKIKLNKLTSSLQSFWLVIFNRIDYMIFEVLNKTQSTQRINFNVIKISDERLKKSKKHFKQLDRETDLEYFLQSQHFAIKLHFTHPPNILFYKTETI